MNLMILLGYIGGCYGGLGFPQPHHGDLSIKNWMNKTMNSRVSAGYLYSGIAGYKNAIILWQHNGNIMDINWDVFCCNKRAFKFTNHFLGIH